MPSLPTPQAARLKPPSWRDTRLVVGILLIAIGILVGSRAVASADESVEVCVASRTLVPGQRVGAGDVRVVRVRLDALDRYLTSPDQLRPGAVAVRAVGEGELVPRAALGVAHQVAARAVAVPAESTQRQWLHVGDTVDVWVTPKEGTTRTPRLLLGGSVVAALPASEDGALGPRGSRAGVQILVPADKVGQVVGAVDREDAITLVPVRQSE